MNSAELDAIEDCGLYAQDPRIGTLCRALRDAWELCEEQAESRRDLTRLVQIYQDGMIKHRTRADVAEEQVRALREALGHVLNEWLAAVMWDTRWTERCYVCLPCARAIGEAAKEEER